MPGLQTPTRNFRLLEDLISPAETVSLPLARAVLLGATFFPAGVFREETEDDREGDRWADELGETEAVDRLVGVAV